MGLETRPMLDRVREALFSTLAPWLAGASVLDLFAGSGSLGLEALSRGARRVRFVERGGQALACLAENVERLGLAQGAVLVRGDALARSSWGEERADIVFLDPPYALLERLGSRRALFRALGELAREHLAPGGVLVFHAPRRAILRSEFPAGLACRERDYGTNALWYVRAGSAAPPEVEESAG